MPHIGHTIPSAGGGGTVTSVATRTGDVVLTAADVGAGTWPGAVKAGAALRLGTQAISGTATLVTGTADVILADTTSAAFTITLPAAPTAGDIFIFVDSAGQWATNNLTVALNGKNLNGAATNAVLTQVNGTFGIYYDGTAWHSIIHAPSDTNPVMDGTAAPGTAFGYSRRDHVHPSDTSRAPLASPTFTGTPLSTTAAVDTNTTQVATTAFVIAQSASATPTIPSNTAGAVGTSTRHSRSDHAHGMPLSPGSQYHLNGASASIRENADRRFGTTSNAIAALTDGVMTSMAIVLYAGDIVTSISFRSGTTAMGATISNWWFALYDTQATPALIAQTADQTSATWNANIVKTLALAAPAPYTVTTTGVHYISVMCHATTVPTFTGFTVNQVSGGMVTGQKAIAQSSGSGLTTTAPGTIASATAVSAVPYGVIT